MIIIRREGSDLKNRFFLFFIRDSALPQSGHGFPAENPSR